MTGLPPTTTGAPVTRRRAAELAGRALVLGVGGAVAAVAALPGLNRYVVLLGGLAVLGCALAALTGGRLAGTLAVLTATSTVLLAGLLDTAGARPTRLLLAAALLLALVEALEACEQHPRRSAHAVILARAALPARLRSRAGALAATGLVTVAAAVDVVPSLGWVLVGLVASVLAVAVAVGGHGRYGPGS